MSAIAIAVLLVVAAVGIYGIACYVIDKPLGGGGGQPRDDLDQDKK